MAIKNSLKGGTDYTTPTARVKPTDLNDTLNSFYQKSYANNSGGSSTSTTETSIATITIPEDDLGSSVSLLINAPISLFANTTSGVEATFRLYVGGVVKKTISMEANARNSSAFAQLITGVDVTSSSVQVKITEEITAYTGTASCTGLVVTAINNND